MVKLVKKKGPKWSTTVKKKSVKYSQKRSKMDINGYKEMEKFKGSIWSKLVKKKVQNGQQQ